MPEIDTELFQWLVLGLLVLIVLIALIVASMISKLTKQAPATTATSGLDEPVERAPVGTAASAAPASGSGEDAVAATRSSWEPTYTSDVGSLTGSEPEASTLTPETTSEPAQEPAPIAAAEPIPEEEPFERDGRWWFKRGDELLVYDEGSGQWQPAPAGSFPETAAAAPAAASSPYSGGTAAEPAGTASTAPAEVTQTGGGEAEGGFWKCPSCGAINGATASSCRMCFTARP